MTFFRPFLYSLSLITFLISSGCSSFKKQTSQPSTLSRSFIDKSASLALKDYDSNFRLWPIKSFMPSVQKIGSGNNPGLISADFNGDKIKDYAVLGHNKSHEFLLAVISTNSNLKKFRVYKIDKATKMNPKSLSRLTSKNKIEFGLWTYLSVLSPARIKSNYEKRSLKFKNHALEVKYFEKGSLVYIFKNNRFEKYISTKE